MSPALVGSEPLAALEHAERVDIPLIPSSFGGAPVALTPTVHEAFSRPPNSSWIHSRQAQESAIMTAVRRQVEALDDKLSGHIAREVQRLQAQGDQLREAAVARLEGKVAALEAQLPKAERRLAELGGVCKGLSEEMQAQIRRIDQTDSRLWEWHHQLDEDMRSKLTEIEQNYQQVCTTVRVAKATTDDVFMRYTARLVRLEELLDERAAHADDLSQSVTDLHTRLLHMEDPSHQQFAALDHNFPAREASSSALAVLERQGSDLLAKIEQLQQEFCELRSWTELQEERYKALRTLYETKDEQHRALVHRVERENWEGRLKELHGRFHDHEQTRMVHAEQLEILHQKLALHDQGRRQADAMAAGRAQVSLLPSAQALCTAMEATGPEVGGSQAMAAMEERIAVLGEELEAVRADLELAPRVAALVEALHDVAPKVIAQEAIVGDLQVRVGELSERAASAQKVEELATELKSLASLVGCDELSEPPVD